MFGSKKKEGAYVMFRNKESNQDTMQAGKAAQTYGDRRAADATLIATGAAIRGDMKTAGSLVVDGTIEGTINAAGDVQIGPKGNVTAEIEGTNITVAGSVKGKIYAEDKVMLVSGSHVEGDIHSQSLRIEDAVFFQGGCVMGEGARKRRTDNNIRLPDSLQSAKTA